MAHRRCPRAAIWRRALPVSALLLLALSDSVLAQQYPPSSGGLTVSASDVSPGAEVTVSGGGYGPNSEVTITFESAPVVLGVVRVDASGQFTTRVRIPVDATPGTHTLRATGAGAQGGPRVLTATINVVGRQAGPASTTGGGAGSRATPGGALARTGSSTALPVSIAAAALIAASALLLLQVRREAQPAGLR